MGELKADVFGELGAADVFGELGATDVCAELGAAFADAESGRNMSRGLGGSTGRAAGVGDDTDCDTVGRDARDPSLAA